MHATNTRACDIFGHRFHFDAFSPVSSSVHTNPICVHFRLDPLSRAFSDRCVFNENAQRISVDGRSKRRDILAFSNENALVRQGLRVG